jgi:hypothetical protein
MSKLTLRFGLMCDDATTLPQWQVQCLKHLLALETVNLEIGLVILNAEPKPEAQPTRQFTDYLPNGGALWARYHRKKIAGRSRALWPARVETLLAEVPQLKCRVQRRQKFEYFGAEDLEQIKAYRLDFILKFGFGRIDGEILETARYGVWAFSHSAADKYVTGPVGFWEIYRGEDVSGAVLQRLYEHGSRVILQKGFFPTIPYSHSDNLDMVYLESVKWPGYVCRDIARGKADYVNSERVETDPALYQEPGNWQMLLFQLKMLKNRLKNTTVKLFRHEQWNVGIVKQPIQAFLKAELKPEIQWLPTPEPNIFIADPFIYEKDGEPTLFVEGYDYRTRKGWISALKKQADSSFAQEKKALELPTVHLSFPYPVKYQGEIYCVPETYQAAEVALYKAQNYPLNWVKAHTLLKDFPAVDTTVFEYEGRWWLLCCEQDGGISENTRLYAWYANDLMADWTAHPGNPLKTDVRSTRPAGTPFIHQGQLYRPTQDCSRTYGGAVTINRVLRLTPEEFCEEPVVQVKPYDKLFNDGLHTLSAAGDFTVLDGKRRIFIWAVFKKELGEIINRRLKR